MKKLLLSLAIACSLLAADTVSAEQGIHGADINQTQSIINQQQSEINLTQEKINDNQIDVNKQNKEELDNIRSQFNTLKTEFDSSKDKHSKELYGLQVQSELEKVKSGINK